MAIIQHKVQAGDTVSDIARRFNVPKESVSGFRSNDPSTIFPDEILTIDTERATQVNADQNTAPGEPVDSRSMSPILPGVQVGGRAVGDFGLGQQPTQPPAQPTGQPVAQPAQQPVAQPVQEPDIELPDGDIPTFETPSGAEVTETGEIVSAPPVLEEFGFSTEQLAQGFDTNPFGTLSEIVSQVMKATGLPDIRNSVTEIANEIESLENERDAEIAKINDNPFFSAGSKAQRAAQVQDKFEQRIANRTNKLTLLQRAQQEARQQAQFAATTAIGLFNQQQRFAQDELERIADAEERKLEAEARLGPLTTETVDGFKVLRDASGDIVSTQKITGAGTVSVPEGAPESLGGIASTANLVGGFGSVASQKLFNDSIQKLAQQGKTRAIAEKVVGQTLSNIKDAEVRKRTVGGFNIAQQLTRLQDLLNEYELKGGDTNILTGNIQKAKQKVGLLGDSNLANIGVQILNTLDTLARSRTGAVISPSEEELYGRMLPGIDKVGDLNDVLIDGLRESLMADVENELRFSITGDGLEQVKSELPDVFGTTDRSVPITQAPETKSWLGSVKAFLFGEN